MIAVQKTARQRVSSVDEGQKRPTYAFSTPRAVNTREIPHPDTKLAENLKMFNSPATKNHIKRMERANIKHNPHLNDSMIPVTKRITSQTVDRYGQIGNTRITAARRDKLWNSYNANLEAPLKRASPISTHVKYRAEKAKPNLLLEDIIRRRKVFKFFDLYI